MSETFTDKIKNDLTECGLSWKVLLYFIPVAFGTYLFHEFGHWTFGEILGNDMTLSLNNASPKSGYFINDNQALWSAIGGPLFTILQTVIFMVLTQRTKSVYAFSVLFFAAFSRFFSIVFGGFNLQDEARIASMMGVNKYLVAVFVLVILFLLVGLAWRFMKLNLKALGYYTVFGVIAVLMVIAVYKFVL